MINSPVLSIVIPTKDRYFYLKDLLQKLLSFERDDFEIIVQDNSSDNLEILNYLENFNNDKRLKYYYDFSLLDMCANSQLAIEKAKGEYVTFIGDDDGITEECIDICKFMAINDIDSANCNIAIYDWPDLYKKYWGYSSSGEVRYAEYSNKIEDVDPSDELIKILSGGAQVVKKGARLYQGIIKRSALDKMRDSCGTYFPGPVPDMSSAVGIVSYINKHIYVDYPLIIAGSSGKSTAGLGAQKKHQAEIKDVSHLPKSTANDWAKEIPFFWSGATIWAQGAIQALRTTGREDLIMYYNFNRLYALCLIYDNEFRIRTIKHLFKSLYKNRVTIIGVGYQVYKIWTTRITNLLKSKMFKVKSNVVVYKAKNISDVINYFQEMKKPQFIYKQD